MNRLRVGASAALLLGLLLGPTLVGAEERPWIEARSPRFTVISNGSERDARATARQFEQIRAVFQALAPGASQEAGRPFTILAVRDEGTMKRLLPGYWERKGGVRPSGLFVNTESQVFVVVRLDLPGADEIGHSVVFHEYVHVLIERQFDGLPLWLNEGLAEFYATSTVESDRVLVGRAARWNLELLGQTALLPMETLLAVDATSPLYNEDDRATIFYGQSWALVHYLINGEKGAHRPKVQAYVEQLRQGVEPVEAGRRAFGDLKALGKKLEVYVRSFQHFMMKVPTPQAPLERDYVVRTLPDAEARAVRANFLAFTGRATEARAEAEEAIRMNPQLSLAWQALVAIHTQERRPEEARKAAAEAVRTDPRSALAQLAVGVLALQHGEAEAAEAALARAVELNDRLAGAHALLAAARQVLRRPKDQILPHVQRALNLEPGKAGILVTLAGVLRDGGELEVARQLGERAERAARSPQERKMVEDVLKLVEGQVPSDPAAAARHHESACQAGTAASCVHAAIRLEEGRGVAQDHPRAVALYGRACDGGSAVGCANLGRLLRHGRGTAKDPARARALYEMACAQKAKNSCEQLAIMLVRDEGGPGDPVRAASLFATGCDAGISYTCTFLGWMHERGKGMPAADPRRGSELYAKACDGGHAEGCRRLGRLYGYGTGVAKDDARAYALNEKACQGGDLEGCARVGFALRKGRGVPRDPTRAAEILARACDGEASAGCSDLGYMYYVGDGVAKDLSRAFALHQRACEGGDSYGCQEAGFALRDGQGVAADAVKAVPLLVRACDEEKPMACLGAGWAYEHGRGVSADAKRALGLYQKACRENEADACSGVFRLRVLDPGGARAFFQNVCEARGVAACGNLGLLHAGGWGGPQDFRKAASRFAAGCDGGDAPSCG